MKTIVISAVNLNKGGTLTILRDCLAYLSLLAAERKYKVVAIVHKKALADFAHIEYIETQWPKKSWYNRLWYEYRSLKVISEKLSPVYLWFSLHDTTPHVLAERRAVYCHNPFPFHRWKWREVLFTPRIVLLSLFSKYVYRKNINQNNYVVVQQQWIREAFLKMFDLQPGKVVVALPERSSLDVSLDAAPDKKKKQFIYAAYYDSHKNFECLLRATEILFKKGRSDFEVLITVKGSENAYARWLFKKWGYLPMLNFYGFMNRDELFQKYASSAALVFPSKAETWGLPITEFAAFDKPMLLADLPYAHESAAGAKKVAFFDPENASELAILMEYIMEGKDGFLEEILPIRFQMPMVTNWATLFELLLTDNLYENTTVR